MGKVKITVKDKLTDKFRPKFMARIPELLGIILKPSKIVFLLSGLLLLIIVSLFLIDYIQLRNNTSLSAAGQVDGQQDLNEAEKSLDELASVLLLPDEKPTIATIVDIDKLKPSNPNFYSQAKNGDKLFVFVQQKRAVIFRPTDNLIINIADIDFNPNQVGQTEL